MVTTVESANKINPHMKFNPQKGGVVMPPQIYRYSLKDELAIGEAQYKEINNTVKRRSLRKFAENHPNLKSNIWSVIKLTGLVLAAGLTFRYRHSIPWLKDMCKEAKKTPPDFKADVQKIWNSICAKFKN